MKEYAIYLPDVQIKNVIDIVYIFNFKNIKIFTTSIYDNNIKVHNDDINKILKLLKTKQIKGIIIYEPYDIPNKNIDMIIKYCYKYNCKLYFFSKKFFCVKYNT